MQASIWPSFGFQSHLSKCTTQVKIFKFVIINSNCFKCCIIDDFWKIVLIYFFFDIFKRLRILWSTICEILQEQWKQSLRTCSQNLSVSSTLDLTYCDHILFFRLKKWWRDRYHWNNSSSRFMRSIFFNWVVRSAPFFWGDRTWSKNYDGRRADLLQLHPTIYKRKRGQINYDHDQDIFPLQTLNLRIYLSQK